MIICRCRCCGDRSKYATMHIKYVETLTFCIIIVELCVKLYLNSISTIIITFVFWLMINYYLMRGFNCTPLCIVSEVFSLIYLWAYLRLLFFVIWLGYLFYLDMAFGWKTSPSESFSFWYVFVRIVPNHLISIKSSWRRFLQQIYDYDCWSIAEVVVEMNALFDNNSSVLLIL